MIGEDGILGGLIDAEARVVETFQRILNQKGITNTGDLADSFTAASTEEGMTISFKMYGEVIDGGRRKGSFPPIKPIKDWINQRGIQPKQGQTKEQLAFAVAANIKKHGIKPRPFIQPTLDEAAQQIIAPEIEINMALDIEKDIQQIFNDWPTNIDINI